MDEDANDFLIFAAIARAGGLAGAAKALGVPKTTISRHLQTLETRLGSLLVNRTTRKFTLTDLGEAYFDYAQRVEASVAEARDFAASVTARPSGTLRISAPADFIIWVLADALAAFQQAQPTLRIEIDCTPRRIDLIGERCDVALRMGPLDDSSLVARHIVTIHRGLFASPAYLRSRLPITEPADLSSHQFVLLEAQADGMMHLSRGNRLEDVPVTGPIVSNSLGTLRALAAAGAGIAYFPRRMAADEIAAGRMEPVLPEWQVAPMEAHYVISARKLLPAKTRLFVEHLADWFGSEGRGQI